MKHFISLNDVPRSQIEAIFRKTDELKEQPIQSLLLENRTMAMLFQKPSTRTRVSFEVAMTQLGGHAVYMGWQDSQLGRGETIADTARTLSRYVDCIVARLNSHKDMLELVKYSDVPVINALTDLLHPCQAISDLYTIDEKLGRMTGIKLAYFGDGSSNVCHSLIHICTKLGMELAIACPKELIPKEEVLENAKRNCRVTGSKIMVTKDPKKAAQGADVFYTDTWVSMGQEKEKETRVKLLRPYQLKQTLVNLGNSPSIVMHCLPAYRGFEVTPAVLDGSRSVIWDQAENRLHVQKAILSLLLEHHTY